MVTRLCTPVKTGEGSIVEDKDLCVLRWPRFLCSFCQWTHGVQYSLSPVLSEEVCFLW